MSITAKEVQELRKISGAGMMECKSALTESDGNIENAFKLLREKGIAKAEKKSNRDANEGLIGIKIEDDTAAIIEVNSETDFVSRNAEFHKLVNNVLNISIKNIENEKNLNTETTELINQAIGKIGENIVLKRFAFLKGNIFSYMHNSVAEGLGKIGVILSIKSENKNISEVGKNICMHIAAASPMSISKDDLDNSIIESEKNIIKQQLKDSGKPDHILEKMMDGKLNKFYEEKTLMSQKFVIEPEITVEQYLKKMSDKLGSQISLRKYIRFEIGL